MFCCRPKMREREEKSMDTFNGANGALGDGAFWDLPVAFAMEDNARERINNMTDEEREVLRNRSSQVKNDHEMDELIRMVAEGKFE